MFLPDRDDGAVVGDIIGQRGQFRNLPGRNHQGRQQNEDPEASVRKPMHCRLRLPEIRCLTNCGTAETTERLNCRTGDPNRLNEDEANKVGRDRHA